MSTLPSLHKLQLAARALHGARFGIFTNYQDWQVLRRYIARRAGYQGVVFE